MYKKILAIGLLAAQVSTAQPVATSTDETTKNVSHPFSIMLEGAPLALQGAGLKATLKVSEQFSVGLTGKMYKMTSDNELTPISGNTYKHELTNYGVLGEYFPMGGVNGWGVYISGGVTSAKVKTTVNDSIFGTNTAEDEKIGAQLTVGYQFTIKLGKTANILFQAGGGWGNGGEVSWNRFSGRSVQLRDSFLLDLNAGAQF